mmetsp:Transcript_56362/g.121449  ORF Transcript_56362/g.121449 Transcript_56362/m.121449 type:complete len:440 (+) Transcript_56362:289-1608(+)
MQGIQGLDLHRLFAERLEPLIELLDAESGEVVEEFLCRQDAELREFILDGLQLERRPIRAHEAQDRFEGHDTHVVHAIRKHGNALTPLLRSIGLRARCSTFGRLSELLLPLLLVRHAHHRRGIRLLLGVRKGLVYFSEDVFEGLVTALHRLGFRCTRRLGCRHHLLQHRARLGRRNGRKWGLLRLLLLPLWSLGGRHQLLPPRARLGRRNNRNWGLLRLLLHPLRSLGGRHQFLPPRARFDRRNGHRWRLLRLLLLLLLSWRGSCLPRVLRSGSQRRNFGYGDALRNVKAQMILKLFQDLRIRDDLIYAHCAPIVQHCASLLPIPLQPGSRKQGKQPVNPLQHLLSLPVLLPTLCFFWAGRRLKLLRRRSWRRLELCLRRRFAQRRAPGLRRQLLLGDRLRKALGRQLLPIRRLRLNLLLEGCLEQCPPMGPTRIDGPA